MIYPTTRLCIIMALLCQFVTGHASIIILNDAMDDFQVKSSDMKIFQDKEGFLTIDEILAVGPESFSNITGKLPSEKGTHYWVRFVLKETSELNNWYLQLPLHSDVISLYYLDTYNNQIAEYHTGQSMPFNTRPIDSRTFLFDLPMNSNKQIVVYAHLFNEKYSDLSFIISKKEKYFEVHTKGYLFLGAIYGLLFLMLLYNTVLYFSFREKIYLYYVLYLLASLFLMTWKDGLGFQFLWPQSPSLNHYHHALALYAIMISFVLYTKEFLNINKFFQKGDTYVYAIIAVLTIHLFVSIFDRSYFEPFPWLYLLLFLFCGVLAGYLLLKKDFKPASYIVLSICCIVFAFTIIKLRYWSLIEWNWFNEYILNYSMVGEAIVMSLAIKDKISFFKKKEGEAMEMTLKKDKLMIENEIIQIKNRGLEWEVKNQNNELALLSEYLTQKTEFLDYIKKELESISDEVKGNSSIKRLVKEIGKEAEMENHWEQFQLNFDKANDNLLTQLKSMFPALKPADLLLCAYIKLGKSNKEIASIFNISISGVEKKRVRLKEKLNLESEMKVTDFIVAFGQKA